MQKSNLMTLTPEMFGEMLDLNGLLRILDGADIMLEGLLQAVIISVKLGRVICYIILPTILLNTGRC